MWAGGSIEGLSRLPLNDELAVCLERIADVTIRGSPGAEKIFVEVLREYVPHREFKRLYQPNLKSLKPLGKLFKVPQEYEGDLKRTTERRTLVFMRELSDGEKMTNLEQGQRIVKRRPALPLFLPLQVPSSSTVSLLFLDPRYPNKPVSEPSNQISPNLTIPYIFMLTLIVNANASFSA
jgi:hypothetical protein